MRLIENTVTGQIVIMDNLGRHILFNLPKNTVLSHIVMFFSIPKIVIFMFKPYVIWRDNVMEFWLYTNGKLEYVGYDNI